MRDAVEHIAIHRPAVVAIEEAFAVSPRGEALVARIMEDPSLSACEIRILAHAHKPERERTSRKSGSAIPVATEFASSFTRP